MISNFFRVIVPTGAQAFWSLLCAIALLGVVFRDRLVALITGSSGVTSSQLQASYTGQLQKLTHIGFMPALTIGVFWAGVGVVGYIVVLEVINVLINVHNEVVVDTTFVNAGSLRSRMTRPLMRIGIAVGLLLYLVLTLRVLLPIWANLTGHVLFGGITVGASADAVGGVVGLAITLYGAWLLAIVLKNFRR